MGALIAGVVLALASVGVWRVVEAAASGRIEANGAVGLRTPATMASKGMGSGSSRRVARSETILRRRINRSNRRRDLRQLAASREGVRADCCRAPCSWHGWGWDSRSSRCTLSPSRGIVQRNEH